MMSRLPSGAHHALARCHVGIAGAGGLGSNVAICLARSAVGTLTIIDFDVIEPSNLNRQQFFIDQLGEAKVKALAINLARINPFVRVLPHEQKLDAAAVPALLGGCDVVVECFDSPSAKAELSFAMRRFLPKTPLVMASGLGGLGPASAIACRRVFGNHFIIGDEASEPDLGLFASRVMLVAAYQAHVALRLLLGAARGE